MITGTALACRIRIIISLFNFWLPIAVLSSTQPIGPMSELTGTAAIVDRILSPGNPKRGSTSNVSGKTYNFTRAPDLISRPSQLSGSLPDYYASTCSISFSRRSNNQESSRNPRGKLTRRNPQSLGENERSAFFMTEAAEKCIESVRQRGAATGYPLGVVSCYSVGYLDQEKLMLGAQVNVFRLGTVAEVNKLLGTEVKELESNMRLQLHFSSRDSPDRLIEFSRSSVEGTLRLSQPAWAPSDDPSHLVNPTNPHFTASYGETETVLIGSFHLNLLDESYNKPSRMRKRDHRADLAELSPVGATLVGRESHTLQSHFIDLSDNLSKRSRLAGTRSWGLFKRQDTATISSKAEFSSDSACLRAGLSPNPFFSGEGEQTPPLPQVARPRSLASTPPSTSVIPPPPLISSSTFSRAKDTTTASSSSPNGFKITRENLIQETLGDNVFQLPGRKLLVFPIGLSIYATLSSVTFLVVVVVTYERKQYRYQFRTRVEEQKSNTGYFQTYAEARV